MEYFNTYTSEYIKAIQDTHNDYRVRLELLSYYENVIGDITSDLSTTIQGQININYQPITRRSCSLSMINVDKKYTPSLNSAFWFERKFKLWIGVVAANGDIYWWAQGVFYTQSATSDGNIVNIEGIDKGGALDGTLGINMAEVQYKIEAGASIDRLIRDTLMLNLYGEDSRRFNNISTKPLDPVMPIIDVKYRKIYTQSEITLDANTYMGDIFTSVSEGYNADIYYDINGHLQLAELTDGSRVDGYKYMAQQWNYDYHNPFYGLANFEYTFDGKNTVIVYTNATEFENVSYAAYNNNPASPIRTDLIGVRRMEAQEIAYTSNTRSEMEKRCKQYANYLLIKEAMRGVNVSFDSPIIPHLDVNRTIGITDKSQGFENETFIIQSITMPLSAGTMNISATSINWLPDASMQEIGV
jgi:hypothetical protein